MKGAGGGCGLGGQELLGGPLACRAPGGGAKEPQGAAAPEMYVCLLACLGQLAVGVYSTDACTLGCWTEAKDSQHLPYVTKRTGLQEDDHLA